MHSAPTDGQRPSTGEQNMKQLSSNARFELPSLRSCGTVWLEFGRTKTIGAAVVSCAARSHVMVAAGSSFAQPKGPGELQILCFSMLVLSKTDET